MLGLALLLGSCATTPKQDKLQVELKEHTQRCVCLMNPKEKINSFQLNWKDKDVISKQIKHCQCTIEFKMDEVENPTDYVKAGTTFMRQGSAMPWDKEEYERLYKVD
jgi:hypothetical protein